MNKTTQGASLIEGVAVSQSAASAFCCHSISIRSSRDSTVEPFSLLHLYHISGVVCDLITKCMKWNLVLSYEVLKCHGNVCCWVTFSKVPECCSFHGHPELAIKVVESDSDYWIHVSARTQIDGCVDDVLLWALRQLLNSTRKKLNTENDQRLAKTQLLNLAPQIELQKITNRIESQSFMSNHSQKLLNHSQKTLKSWFKSQSWFGFAQHWSPYLLSV